MREVLILRGVTMILYPLHSLFAENGYRQGQLECTRKVDHEYRKNFYNISRYRISEQRAAESVGNDSVGEARFLVPGRA